MPSYIPAPNPDEELDPELAELLQDESFWNALQESAIEPSNKGLWAYFAGSIGFLAWAHGAMRSSKQMTGSTDQARKWVTSTDHANRWFKERGAQFVKDVSETDRNHIRKLLVDNWGVGERQFARNIADDYLLSKERAMLIYRSETHETNESGAYANAFYNGGKFKVWIVNSLNACNECLKVNGEVRPIEQPFSNGFMLAHSHPRCGCNSAFYISSPSKEDLSNLSHMPPANPRWR